MTALSWSRSRRARLERISDYYAEDGLRRAWRVACEGVGLVHRVDTVSGATVIVPRVASFGAGPPTSLLVELLPGQLPTDVEAVALRLAPALGCRRLRVTPCGEMWVNVELLASDPLESSYEAPASSGLVTASEPVFFGQDEVGRPVELAPVNWPHLVVQGCTGSGKSRWLYGVIPQLAARPDVLLAGADPTGLLLRPFTGTRHDVWMTSGMAEPLAHVELLERLVVEMDRRVLELPLDRDEVNVSTDLPLIIVLLEELPGLLRTVEQVDTKAYKRLRMLLSRLLAEARKAGMRVVMITQRAEATILGGFERGQASLRVSFRVDNADAVRLLHPATPADQASEHMTAQPGIALMTAPGVPLRRFRAPMIRSYAHYAASVAIEQVTINTAGNGVSRCVMSRF
jgi:S-DNA-T family DNA segregation ATPase FtsK/SpoIIIE